MGNEANDKMNDKNIPQKSKKLLTYVAIVLIVLVIFVIAWVFIVKQQSKVSVPEPVTTTEVQDVKSDNDLKKLEDEVKGTDIDNLSKDLEQNDKDAVEF
ncbi:MAG: hypothetical protein A3A57_01090 [Candidatus Woykebacteria bacterium RIFCSPLOWO2_01_FULL_41_12]|uniref:Uncharacterized protein n=1 Tax=Candidatus Woykebacteria bacterium RIFCSPLOWO2_01_FULL_41_12 TaxID=1802604 RepID=A0A1G1WYF0_9BACT|nr:MAG: hypothetical protein A3A57_01090 [Candidatus Woykebacteria bacterium RIFCSPLOWO2_01_FULL_41_12]